MIRFVGIVLFCVLLAGCAVLSTGERVGLGDTDELACHSHAGSYALPKTFLAIKINRTLNMEVATYKLDEINTVRREDPRHTYCLDYNPNPTAKEKVYVYKSGIAGKTKPANADAAIPAIITQTNLLHYVSTDVIDRSRKIAQKLIETIFKAAAGAGRSRQRDLLIGDAGATVLDIEFDPFHPGRTALVNDALREFGFCVMLGGYTIDLEHVNIDQYCDNPMRMEKHHPPQLNDDDDLTEALHTYEERIDDPPEGILYRPVIAYNLYVFGKKDRSLDGGWQLRVKRVVKLENISPIISVGVDRTFFAQRRTTLVFTGGVLKKVCIYKTSELLEFVQIPLTIVKSIVVLPTQILQLRIDDVKGEADLITAQNKLIKAQLDYLDALKNPASDAAKAKTAENLTLPGGRAPSNLFKPFDELGPGLSESSFKIIAGDSQTDPCPKPKSTELDQI